MINYGGNMKLLFTLDSKNYTDDLDIIERFAVRGVICKNGLWAMQKSNTGEYKIPGGGIEKGEGKEEALYREVLEETGLHVLNNSIREIGEVLEVRRDNFNSEQKYISHSYYYFCEVDEVISDTCMSENELARGYQLEWASMEEIIAENRIFCTEIWQKRDLQLLEWVRENMNK